MEKSKELTAKNYENFLHFDYKYFLPFIIMVYKLNFLFIYNPFITVLLYFLNCSFNLNDG